MRFSVYVIALMTSVSSGVLAQDPGPSPTASVGCEPHGDHWHCDGPASTGVSVTSTASEVEASTTAHVTPTAPSPTESVGCEPHGDHWHCDGPAETASASASGSASASASASTSSKDAGSGAGAIGVQMFMLVGLSLVAAGVNV
ncbi:uncharacterized protein PGRI_089710 [Penicillium griseofulvum]|uniref:Uncharacterized protein n=1 Tax=Penicillium patulum TaxID=5078 RepID=A0A135LRH4_PENPA|nr:uncharacterized protein PGRI_089710 [Penicillium griseofulvum]KXG51578.1 hypothetical protein PGRI_089710 [Penicillium griseofulvum]